MYAEKCLLDVLMGGIVDLVAYAQLCRMVQAMTLSLYLGSGSFRPQMGVSSETHPHSTFLAPDRKGAGAPEVFLGVPWCGSSCYYLTYTC